MTGRGQWSEGQLVPMIDIEGCNGCGHCITICPTGALALKNGRTVVSHPRQCQYTGWCSRICPAGAIDRWFHIVSEQQIPSESKS